MKRTLIAGLALCAGLDAHAQNSFQAGEPLGTVNESGEATPLSDNVRVFGSFRFAESCTFDPERNLILAMGDLVRTEHAVESGNDGIVVAADGTKYVSSVRYGSVSRIRPGEPAEIIASGIPSAASLCHDSRQNQLIIPMNDNNALAFIPL